MSAVLKQIAAIAKGLNKAELHVLIELASRAESAGGQYAVASSRELAEQTGLARSSVQLAIDSLQKKGLLHSNTGTATRPAAHWLLFLEAVEQEEGGPEIRPGVAQESGLGGLRIGPGVAQIPGQGGPTVGPVVASESGLGGLKTGPGVARKPGQGGLNFGPRSVAESNTCEPAYKENASAHAESIEKYDFDNLIDQLQNAKKSDFDNGLFEEARHLIASHHAKFAPADSRIAGLPDDQITAQFLAIAEWPRLHGVLWDLMSERKQSSHSWAWYITVALQRIHGISPDRIRELRMKLKRPASAGSRQSTSAYPSGSGGSHSPSRGVPIRDTSLDFRNQIRTLAANKAMR